jgi:hypothetical protein
MIAIGAHPLLEQLGLHYKHNQQEAEVFCGERGHPAGIKKTRLMPDTFTS